MTLAEMRDTVARKVDEDTSSAFRYVTDAMIDRALNRAQSIFCFLTLCYETSGSISFTTANPSLQFLSSLPDFIAALRVSQSGGLILPRSLQEFAARHNQWLGASGVPSAYALVAANLIAVYPPPASAGVGAVLVNYAAFAPTLTGSSQVSTVPLEDHEALTQGAAYFIRTIVLGGQYGQSGMEDMAGFWTAIQRRASFVSQRSMLSRYDTLPAGVSKDVLKKFLETSK